MECSVFSVSDSAFCVFVTVTEELRDETVAERSWREGCLPFQAAGRRAAWLRCDRGGKEMAPCFLKSHTVSSSPWDARAQRSGKLLRFGHLSPRPPTRPFHTTRAMEQILRRYRRWVTELKRRVLIQPLLLETVYGKQARFRTNSAAWDSWSPYSFAMIRYWVSHGQWCRAVCVCVQCSSPSVQKQLKDTMVCPPAHSDLIHNDLDSLRFNV